MEKANDDATCNEGARKWLLQPFKDKTADENKITTRRSLGIGHTVTLPLPALLAGQGGDCGHADVSVDGKSVTDPRVAAVVVRASAVRMRREGDLATALPALAALVALTTAAVTKQADLPLAALIAFAVICIVLAVVVARSGSLRVQADSLEGIAELWEEEARGAAVQLVQRTPETTGQRENYPQEEGDLAEST